MAGSPRIEMLYDADCGLCTRTRDRVMRLDGRRGRIRPVALQEAEPPTGYTYADLARALHVVDLRTGAVAAGFAATVSIARQLPQLAWLTPLTRIPGVGWLGERLYAAIARRRSTTCSICFDEPQALRR